MDDAAEDDDSTESIIDQLTDDDKEAVRNYAKSLLDRSESVNDGMGMEGPEEEPIPGGGQMMPGQQPMMEITKGRLKNVQRILALNENLRNNDREDNKSYRKQKKVHKKHGRKSPFDSPLY